MKKFLFIAVALCCCRMLAAQTTPVANNDTFQITKNTQVLFPVLSNDFDIDGDPLIVSLITLPVNGTASVAGTQIDYQPAFNFTGTDSFTYSICDTTNLCDTALVFIRIAEGNSDPVAVDDSFTIPENISSSLPVIANDHDPDGDALSVSVLTAPVNGTAVVSGTQIVYTPQQFYDGADSFVYVICDPSGACDTATVYLIITGINLHPVYEQTEFVFGDTVFVISIDQTVSDPEGDSVYYLSVTNLDTANSIGSLDIDAGGVLLQFTRDGIACGTNRYQFVLCDPFSCDTGIISITVNCPENVFLPEGFSPDGDGINDFLVFTGLEYFAPASLIVFNRYGTIVYENSDYKNDWNGTYIENNNPLPDGTYYYILELGDKRHYRNYLIINR